jgi:hypothetical protein
MTDSKEIQQFPLFNCNPGSFLKMQFSDLHVRTSQYGREIFQFALQKVLFYGTFWQIKESIKVKE